MFRNRRLRSFRIGDGQLHLIDESACNEVVVNVGNKYHVRVLEATEECQEQIGQY
jgi:hypothetical protein